MILSALRSKRIDFILLFNIDGCCDAILKNCFVRLIRRILPLLLALWHYVDIGLDVNQSISYYHHAYDTNGTYRRWALKYRNETNTTYLQTVSPGYFYVASVAWVLPWVLPSFLFTLSRCADYGEHEDNQELVPFIKSTIKLCCRKDNKICYRISSMTLITLFFLPFGTFLLLITFLYHFIYPFVITFLFLYLVIPLNLIYNAIYAVIKGDDFEEENDYGCVLPAVYLTLAKTLEIFGEALPQFILNAVYIANNYYYLLDNDVYFDIPVPISIISAVFSFGSLMMGFKTGFDWYKNFQYYDMNMLKEGELRRTSKKF